MCTCSVALIASEMAKAIKKAVTVSLRVLVYSSLQVCELQLDVWK